MQLLKLQNQLTLRKETGELVKVDQGHIIKYIGRFYNKTETSYVVTEFIGIIDNYRFNQDEGYTGIYVRPLYVWNNTEGDWNKLINVRKYPEQKYFLYPHLLMLPDCYYHFQPLYFLHSCDNISLKDYTHIVRTMDINQPYGEGMSYNYIVMKTKPDVFRQELMQQALHPLRITQWLEADYFDDA